jgi:3',5'-cyclic-AMP phosphodiesterase
MKRVLAFVFLALGCGPGAGERAHFDLEVGVAEAGGMRFEVGDGLAAVLLAEPGRIVLRGSAPTFDIAIVPITAEPVTAWSIELVNALADATLAGVVAEVLPSDRPTQKRWHVELPAAGATLSVGAPDALDPSPWSFALMSDVQQRIHDVDEVFAKMNETGGFRFLLGAGDITQDGTVPELEAFDEKLKTLAVPYFTTLGNHDVPLGDEWQRRMGRANFRFVFRGVQFTLVDSGSASLDPLVYQWLDGWLAEGKDRVHVFAMHVPAFDPVGIRNGAFGSRAEAAALVGDLAAAGVDLTLYGHIHSFYAFENGGIPAFISGGGGALPEKLDGIGRHFMVIDVDPRLGVGQKRVVEVDPD